MSTDVRQVREQIRNAEQEQGRLREERGAAQQELDAQLKRTASSGPFAFNPSEARRLRTEIAGFDAFLADVESRIEHLHQLLPTTSTIDAARRECAALQTTLDASEQEFRHAGEQYMATIDAAEAAARQLLTCRAASRDLAVRLATTIAAAGLESEYTAPALGDVARCPPALVKVAGLQLLFVRDAASGDEDPQVVRELNAARVEAAA